VVMAPPLCGHGNTTSATLHTNSALHGHTIFNGASGAGACARCEDPWRPSEHPEGCVEGHGNMLTALRRNSMR
jgi:hypothetical protein